jgi:Uma2 family endonuclease
MLTRSGVERIPMSREEFYRRAENLDECLQDWEDGVAIRVTAPHSRHGYFRDKLIVRLDPHVPEGKVRSEIFVDFPNRTYGADIAVLFAPHVKQHQKGRFKGPPDIIVEVISPDSADRDRVEKFDAYYEQGVAWYWIGDPAAGTLEEYHRAPDGYVRTASGSLSHPFKPKALAGLTIELADLLED